MKEKKKQFFIILGITTLAWFSDTISPFLEDKSKHFLEDKSKHSKYIITKQPDIPEPDYPEIREVRNLSGAIGTPIAFSVE